MTLLFSQQRKFCNMGYHIFKHLSIFSGLKPNKSDCEIATAGVLKGVQIAFCGMKCVNLKTNTIKI